MLLDADFDRIERETRMRLSELHFEFKIKAKPLIDILCYIESLRPVPPILMPIQPFGPDHPIPNWQEPQCPERSK